MINFKDKRHVLFDPETMRLEFDPAGDPKSPWVTLQDHHFRNGVFSVTVPKGLRTDLASVPRALLFLSDPIGNHQRAALFHDAAYREQFCSRFTADAIFRVIMERDGVSYLRSLLMYYAVRLFAGAAWQGHARRLKANEVADDGR